METKEQKLSRLIDEICDEPDLYYLVLKWLKLGRPNIDEFLNNYHYGVTGLLLPRKSI